MAFHWDSGQEAAGVRLPGIMLELSSTQGSRKESARQTDHVKDVSNPQGVLLHPREHAPGDADF